MKTTRSPGANSGEPSSRLRITACHPLMRARNRRSALGWGWIDSISTTLAITEDMGVYLSGSGIIDQRQGHKGLQGLTRTISDVFSSLQSLQSFMSFGSFFLQHFQIRELRHQLPLPRLLEEYGEAGLVAFPFHVQDHAGSQRGVADAAAALDGAAGGGGGRGGGGPRRGQVRARRAGAAARDGRSSAAAAWRPGAAAVVVMARRGGRRRRRSRRPGPAGRSARGGRGPGSGRRR